MANGFQSGIALGQAFLQGRNRRRSEQLMDALSSNMGAHRKLINSPEFLELSQIDPQAAQRVQNVSLLRQDALFKDVRQGKNILQGGDIQGFVNFVQNRAGEIQKLGGNPSDTLSILDTLNNSGAQAALNQLEVLDKAGVESGFLKPTTTQEGKVGRFKSQVLGNELVITDSVTGEIVATRKAPETKKQKLELKKLEAQAEKAQTESQIKALTAETNEQKKDAAVSMAIEAADLADKIAANQNLSNVVGTVDALTPVIRTSSQDLINDALRLESLLTVDNLKLMSGVLTDRDIKFLTRVGSGLNITDTGIKGSESAVRNRLGEISKKIRTAMGGAQQPVNNVSTLSDDELFN